MARTNLGRVVGGLVASDIVAGTGISVDTTSQPGKAIISTAASVNVVRSSIHRDSYDVDTLEIITDSSGKVTDIYFVTV